MENGDLQIVRGSSKDRQAPKIVTIPYFPFKFFLCQFCNRPFRASAPPRQIGARHIRLITAQEIINIMAINKKTFEDAVVTYVHSLRVEERNPMLPDSGRHQRKLGFRKFQASAWNAVVRP